MGIFDNVLILVLVEDTRGDTRAKKPLWVVKS